MTFSVSAVTFMSSTMGNENFVFAHKNEAFQMTFGMSKHERGPHDSMLT
jgi:hypothetical protein